MKKLPSLTLDDPCIPDTSPAYRSICSLAFPCSTLDFRLVGVREWQVRSQTLLAVRIKKIRLLFSLLNISFCLNSLVDLDLSLLAESAK